jgi:hypothetical protein
MTPGFQPCTASAGRSSGGISVGIELAILDAVKQQFLEIDIGG